MQRFSSHGMRHLSFLAAAGAALIAGGACDASGGDGAPPYGTSGTGGSDAAGGAGGAAGDSGAAGEAGAGSGGVPEGGGTAGTGGTVLIDAALDSDAGPIQLPDPKTCEEADALDSYVGCHFWPTVLPNPVWNTFDFAVVVANAGTDPAEVTVERGSNVVVPATTVQPKQLVTLYLPWVPELKPTEADNCASSTAPTASIRADAGAYHLSSTRPVTVYQFNPIEFEPVGGAPGKDWTSCPGANSPCALLGVLCLSYTNDASLLLPQEAMTGNYRVFTYHGWTAENAPGYFSITATEDGTSVKVKVSSTGAISAGTGVAATPAGGVLTLTMDAGDVVVLMGGGTDASDLSGSLVQADKPVQVLGGFSCLQVPFAAAACDHVEESVFPAETLGKHYFVTRPTGPAGQAVGHLVRIYGNADGTSLSYPAATPSPAPAFIDAGEVFDMGIVNMDFEIVGDKEFAVATYQQGGTVVDPLAVPGTRKGDPSQSQSIAVEQYRPSYYFIAPANYQQNWVDIIQPLAAKVTLDGSAVQIAPVPIGTASWGVARVQLPNTTGGAHVIQSDQPVGIQVIGYGTTTSYQFPGGLSLLGIAPPPPPIQ